MATAVPKEGDIETGNGGAELYPNMAEKPELRWAFIRKVYCILVLQILLNAAFAAIVVFVEPVRAFIFANTTPSIVIGLTLLFAPFVIMVPMGLLRERYPWNLVLLVLFTLCVGFSVGIMCKITNGIVIVEAAVLTFVVVNGLTLYTFWAARRGHDFGFLLPFLFAALLILLSYNLIQIFYPLGKVSTTIYGGLATLVFSGLLIYDTDNLIKRHSYDGYVIAAISLYLDVVNLFFSFIALVGSSFRSSK